MTHPANLPAGTRLPAGLGVSVVLPDMDFETYSEAGMAWVPTPTPKNPEAGKWVGPKGAPKGGKGLPVIGAAVYSEHPSTEILTLSYNLKDGQGVRRWRPGLPNPQPLFDCLARGGLVEAWNSAFEWWIWNCVGVRRHGRPPLNLLQTRCAMGKARASGLPGKLLEAGGVLGLDVQKDKRGRDLLDLFSVPQTPTLKDRRRRVRPEDKPEEAEALYAYCDTDTIAEAGVSAVTADLEGEELDFWMADQLINRRGVHVDKPSLLACVAIVEQCLEQFDGEMLRLTGGVVERPSQLERLRGWLAGQGVHVPAGKGTMDEEAITGYLKNLAPHPPGGVNPARRALELRQLAGSASVKKVFAMRNQLSSRDRLHDLFNYHGARTGRPTGEGPQPTNLPKAGPPVYKCGCGRYHGTHAAACPWCGLPVMKRKAAEWGDASVEDALEIIRTQSMAAVQWFFGDAMLTVSGCLRGLFCAAPGHDLIASDFSAIESVVTAVLAGEQWRVDMFHTHGKNYEMAASKISGVPFEEFMAHAGYTDLSGEWWTRKPPPGFSHHPLRQTLGKVSELASGFGGWIGAWVKFGADAFMTEDEIKRAILAWRAASPAIVEFWGGQERREGWNRRPELFGLEGMAIAAVMQPGTWFPVMRLDGTHSGVSMYYGGPADNILYCRLPSGRDLKYRNPRLEPSGRDWGGEWSLCYDGWNSNAQTGPVGWNTMYLYGGKWCENVVQAVARDIQRTAILNLERGGYPVVLHVYDEDVAEVPHGVGSVEGLEAHMMRLPPWAVYKGVPWPIKAAGGWRGRRYRKA